MPRAARVRLQPLADTPLARFLVGSPTAPPTLQEARRATLSGVVLERAPDHPDHAALRRDAFRTAARHLAVKTELRRLVQAWNELGIVPLVMKGFYLSEFVYPEPAARVYTDVDLYLPPARVAAACDAAQAAGWRVAWRVDEPDDVRAWRGPGYHGHEAAHLVHPSLNVRVDVHRRLVHNSHERVARFGLQARLTEAAVSAALDTEWCGLHVRIPTPADAVVFGLALNRSWSADRWWVKPRDYVDIDALRRRYQLDRDTIVRRASEVGVRRTVDVYLSRCDPFRQRLLLEPPRRVWWWNLVVLTERGPHDLVRSGTNALQSVAEAVLGGWMLIRTWPLAQRAMRFVREREPIDGWIARYPVASRERPVRRHAWLALVRAVHRHHRLRRVEVAERHAPAALVGFAWLRLHGHAAELLADGDTQEATTLILDGAPLETLQSAYDLDADEA